MAASGGPSEVTERLAGGNGGYGGGGGGNGGNGGFGGGGGGFGPGAVASPADNCGRK